jgi:hypothetical protein
MGASSPKDVFKQVDGVTMVVKDAAGNEKGAMRYVLSADGKTLSIQRTQVSSGEGADKTWDFAAGTSISVNLDAGISLDDVSLTMGRSSDGKDVFGVAMEVKKEGKSLGSFNIGHTEEGVTTYAFTLKGALALTVLKDLLGASSAADIVGQLDGLTMTLSDKDGNARGQVRYAREGNDFVVYTRQAIGAGQEDWQDDDAHWTAWAEKDRTSLAEGSGIAVGDVNLSLGAGSDGETIFNATIDVGTGAKAFGTFTIGKSGEGTAFNMSLKGQFAVNMLMGFLGVASEKDLLKQLDGYQFKSAAANQHDDTYTGTFRYRVDETGTIHVEEEKGEWFKDGPNWQQWKEVASFKPGDASFDKATFSMGISDGDKSCAFGLDFVKDGEKVAFNIQVAKKEDGTYQTQYLLSPEGKVAVQILMAVMGASSEAELVQRLDGYEWNSPEANRHDDTYTGTFRYHIGEDGKIHVQEERGAWFNFGPGWEQWKDVAVIDAVDFSHARLMTGTTSGGDDLFSFTADLMSGGKKSGSFNVQITKKDDGSYKTQTFLAAEGKLAVDIMMAMAGATSRADLLQGLDYQTFTVSAPHKEDDSYTGTFRYRVGMDGSVTIEQERSGAWDEPGWDPVTTFSPDEMDYDHASLMVGPADGGDDMVSFTMDAKRDGEKIASLGISIGKREDGSAKTQYLLSAEGKAAVAIMMAAAGVRTQEDLVRLCVNGVEFESPAANQANDEYTGTFRYTVQDDGTILIEEEKGEWFSDTPGWTPWVTVGVISGQADFAHAQLSVSISDGQEDATAFNLDFKDKGETQASVTLQRSKKEDGDGYQTQFFVTPKGAMAMDIVMAAMGAYSREEVIQRLDGFVFQNKSVNQQNDSYTGYFRYSVAADGTIEMQQERAKFNDYGSWDSTYWETVTTFKASEIDFNHATLVTGTDADGNNMFSFSMDIKRDGERIGSFSIDVSRDEDG